MSTSFGGRPLVACPTMRASGVRPSARAFSADITTTAAAPSFTPGALPAVTLPSFLNAGFSAGQRLRRSCPRGSPRRDRTTIGAPFFCGISTGTISSLNQPSRVACAALRWLSAAY